MPALLFQLIGSVLTLFSAFCFNAAIENLDPLHSDLTDSAHERAGDFITEQPVLSLVLAFLADVVLGKLIL